MATAKVSAKKPKRNQRRVIVGRVDNKPIPGTPGNVITAKFATIGEGERFMGRIAEHDPKGVEKGKYYIDAPEYMQNRRK